MIKGDLYVIEFPCRRSPIGYLGRWHACIFLGIIKTFLCFRDVLSAHMFSKASRKGAIGRDKDTVLKILQSIVEKNINNR
jgi:hypothetical protein